MKIALVCKQYSLEKGGLQRYTIFLSRELIRAGHEVHVFANTWQRDPVGIIHHVPMFHFFSPLKNLSFAFLSNHALSKMSFNVIHSMERIFYQDIFRISDGINPVQLSQRYPNPAVRLFKAMGPRRLALSYLEHKIFVDRGCKVIMTNSELMKRHIMKHYKVPFQKIVVIYNAVNTSQFHPGVKEEYGASIRNKYHIKQDDLVLLFISNNFKLKRLQTILNSLTLLNKREIKLLVVGNDSERPYKKWIAKKALDKQVLFLGPKKRVEKYYAASDIFVLPTLYDAFANVCLEAMACGLPVITTRNNGASELIDDKQHGYILETQEPGELAGKIRALEFRIERSRMGENAAKKAKGFTVERHMSQVLTLYERINCQKKK
jgi:UDP-glucose:(heptosyl)LPS alpha-1,3-glucosyltransferase